MSERDETLSLGSDFPPVSEEQWRRLVDQVLTRGAADADPDAAAHRFERFVTTTYDGLRVEPLYTAVDARTRAGRRTPRARAVHPRHQTARRTARQAGTSASASLAADDDAGTALQIRDELERGTTSIVLDLTSRASIDADASTPCSTACSWTC